MIKGKTRTGFEFEINENIKTDWRFVRGFALTQKKAEGAEGVVNTVNFVSLILGENEEALYKHLEEKLGEVQTEAVLNEVADIMKVLNEENATKK